MNYKSWGEIEVIHETIARVEATGNHDNLIRVISALTDSEKGARFFYQKDYSKAINKFESALNLINGIHEAAVIRSLLHSGLVSAYASTGRYKQAIASGKEALQYLNQDKRLAISYSNCLHDIGAALANSGNPEEGLEYMEKALRTYETCQDGAERAANCLENIEQIKEYLAQHNKNSKSSRGFLSRLFS